MINMSLNAKLPNKIGNISLNSKIFKITPTDCQPCHGDCRGKICIFRHLTSHILIT